MATKPVQVKPTREVTATEVREQWSDILNRVAYVGEHVNVVRRGKIVARIVPPEGTAA